MEKEKTNKVIREWKVKGIPSEPEPESAASRVIREPVGDWRTGGVMEKGWCEEGAQGWHSVSQAYTHFRNHTHTLMRIRMCVSTYASTYAPDLRRKLLSDLHNDYAAAIGRYIIDFMYTPE